MKHISTLFLPIVLLSLSAVVCLPGCTAQDIATMQQARDNTASAIQQAQSAHDQIQQQLTTMPADDPVRQQLQPVLDRLDQVIAKAQAYLPVLDAAIKSAQTGQIDPSLQQAVSVIPYGSLALAVLGVVFGIVKHIQAGNLATDQQQIQNAFEQVVTAMNTAFPTPTPEQQAKIDSVLAPNVKAQVAAVTGK